MIKRRLDAKDLQPVRAYLGDTNTQLNSPLDTKIVAQAIPTSHPQGGGIRGINAERISTHAYREGMWDIKF